MLIFLLFKAFTVLVGFLSVALTKIAIHRYHLWRSLRDVPGPSITSYIWGEEWTLFHGVPGSLYIDWHRKYGKVVKFTGAFGHPILSITDPRAISFILGEGIYSFPKPEGVRAWFKATLGEGILWVEGKRAHEIQRRIVAPALSQQSVRDMIPVFMETSTKLATQWSKILDESHGEEIEIEVTRWAGRFALDTIGRAAFSYDFDSLSGNAHALAEALDALTNCENKKSSFYIRALFWIFPSILNIGKKGEMIRRTKQELGAIASTMWRDAKTAGETDGKTMLAVMLKADTGARRHLNEEQVIAQMRTVISAGYETVSAVAAWVLYELSQDQAVQTKLRKEISTVKITSLETINQCHFLDAVLKETLRLHPAILENHHEAAGDICVPLSEPLPGTMNQFLFIPKGTLLGIPINVVQNNESFWGTDCQNFRPTRWLEKGEKGLLNGHELLAFSEGPRSCVGKNFAMAEIKILVVTLLHQFAFTCEQEIEPFQSFVVRPRVKGENISSLPLKIHRI